MKGQRGMAAVMTALMLFIGLVAVLYLWWGEYEQRLELTEDVEQLESSLKSRKRDLQDRTAKLDDEQSTSFRLNQQIRKLKEENKQYQSKVSEADKATNSVKAQLSSTEQKLSSLKTSLESSAAEKEQAVKDAVAKSDEEKAVLASELEQAQAKLIALDEEFTSLKSNLEVAIKDKDLALANVSKSDEQMASLKSKHTALSSEVSTLKQDLSKSKEALSQSQAALSKSQAALSKSQAALKDEKAKSVQVQQQINKSARQSNEEKVILEKKNQALVDDKVRLEKQVAELTQARDVPSVPNTESINNQAVSQSGAATQL
ncbi:MAG: hypothetical protein ACRBBR_14610 [Cellvibrionaceae bacterium]